MAVDSVCRDILPRSTCRCARPRLRRARRYRRPGGCRRHEPLCRAVLARARSDRSALPVQRRTDTGPMADRRRGHRRSGAGAERGDTRPAGVCPDGAGRPLDDGAGAANEWRRIDARQHAAGRDPDTRQRIATGGCQHARRCALAIAVAVSRVWRGFRPVCGHGPADGGRRTLRRDGAGHACGGRAKSGSAWRSARRPRASCAP